MINFSCSRRTLVMQEGQKPQNVPLQWKSGTLLFFRSGRVHLCVLTRCDAALFHRVRVSLKLGAPPSQEPLIPPQTSPRA
ncbi:hypothetical protein INR49_008922, partial [Caranx melampygus]